MAAPILWTPGKNAFFLQEKPLSIKFLVLGGGDILGFFWGGECRFYFYGREDFSDNSAKISGISKPYRLAKPMVCMRVALHGNHENDGNDKDNSDSYYRAFLKGGDLNPEERHSRDIRAEGTVTLCTLRAATVLSRDCRADLVVP